MTVAEISQARVQGISVGSAEAFGPVAAAADGAVASDVVVEGLGVETAVAVGAEPGAIVTSSGAFCFFGVSFGGRTSGEKSFSFQGTDIRRSNPGFCSFT